MHKESKPREIKRLFASSFNLSSKQIEYLNKSKESFIYEVIYKNIDESDYEILYDNDLNYKEAKDSSYNNSTPKGSSLFPNERFDTAVISRKRVRATGRPNSPVRDLVTALIVLNSNGWTHKELFDNLRFNHLTRRAFGLYGLDENLFSEATFYKFQKRLLDHWLKTGVNLLELSFQKLTASMMASLGLKTDIIRMDSFEAMSNITSYSRARLVVEVLRRVFRILSEEEQELHNDLFAPYLKKSSSKYVYDLNSEEYVSHLDILAKVYAKVFDKFNDKYKENDVFKIFIRVFNEHFTIIDNKFIPKDSKDLSSDSLQSPDDEEATFRTKRGKNFKGYVTTVTETANPDNKVQLIVDISTDANNVDDSNILNSRIDTIKEQYEAVDELHADGAYGSKENDEKLEKLDITMVQTAIRGRKPKVKIIIKETEVGDFAVECPLQEVIANEGKKKYKAIFNNDVCENCPLADKCKMKNSKKGRVFYFSKEQLKASIRNNNIDNIPKERQKLRPNVEATVKEFTKNLNHKGKFKLRGRFKVALHAIAMSISINLGRIYRLFRKNRVVFPVFVQIYLFLSINRVFYLKNKAIS